MQTEYLKWKAQNEKLLGKSFCRIIRNKLFTAGCLGGCPPPPWSWRTRSSPSARSGTAGRTCLAGCEKCVDFYTNWLFLSAAKPRPCNSHCCCCGDYFGVHFFFKILLKSLWHNICRQEWSDKAFLLLTHQNDLKIQIWPHPPNIIWGCPIFLILYFLCVTTYSISKNIF